MAGIPSHCPNCGHIFFAAGISIQGAASITLKNNITPCPRCGRAADILDGTFDFVNDAVHVRKAPQKTIDILSTLQAALRDLQQGKSEDLVIAMIEEKSPKLAAEIKKQTSVSSVPILATLLLTLLAQCSMNTTATLNWNQIVDQLHVYQTGKAPYPGLGQSEQTGSIPEEKPRQNRQQRRHQDHQSRKKSPPLEPRKKR